MRKLLVVLVVFLATNHPLWGTMATECQTLSVSQANLVVIGRVAYLGKPIRMLSSPTIDYQVVVFRVEQPIKGAYDLPFIRMSFRFSFDDQSQLLNQLNSGAYELSQQAFAIGSEWAIVISDGPIDLPQTTATRRQDVCSDPEPSVDFADYSGTPCYPASINSVLRADDSKILAIREANHR